jgi:hypothetical protein
MTNGIHSHFSNAPSTYPGISYHPGKWTGNEFFLQIAGKFLFGPLQKYIPQHPFHFGVNFNFFSKVATKVKGVPENIFLGGETDIGPKTSSNNIDS